MATRRTARQQLRPRCCSWDVLTATVARMPTASLCATIIGHLATVVVTLSQDQLLFRQKVSPAFINYKTQFSTHCRTSASPHPPHEVSLQQNGSGLCMVTIISLVIKLGSLLYYTKCASCIWSLSWSLIM
jgi:hypothetical protein